MKKQKQFVDVMTQLMRPPGGGIPTVSAGSGAALDLQRRHYAVIGLKSDATPTEIDAVWRKQISALAANKEQPAVVLLGVPLDTGAGIRRGAAYGPRGVRAKLLESSVYREWLRKGEVVDLGDIYVNPHLLHDDMLNSAQIKNSQTAMYPDAAPGIRSKLPVSALSQLKRAVQEIQSLRPQTRVFVIGGDHSVAWPVTEIIAPQHKGTFAIVQPDAHTDLLQQRLGVKYCFGTWSFHANELIKSHVPRGQPKDGRLVQLGIRQSGRDRKHWESTTGVKQYWACDINQRKSHEVVAELVAHLKARGVTAVYFSNDIDGTDETEAPATGTPASDGLRSAFLLEVIEALGTCFDLVAADIVEVAPDLSDTKGRDATCQLAAQYAIACMKHQRR